jgi:hypothetical protein
MKNKKLILVICLLLVAATIIIFSPNNINNKMNLQSYNNSIKLISQKNIFFGHRSVGENIIAGLKKASIETGQNDLTIKDLSDNINFDKKCFVHSNIGQNGDPKSKFIEFKSIVEDLVGKKLDVAMMKLCFVDITKNTNINDVFKSYAAMVDSLQQKYPALIIIHISVPLKSQQSWTNNLKEKIKGIHNYDKEDNIARNEYNKLLFSKYSNDDIFDLASAESTYLDGKREYLNVDGKPCYYLIKDYTDDGGHLNKVGQQLIAEKFIIKISERITLHDKSLKDNNKNLLK